MIAAFRLSLGLFTVVPAGPRGSAEPTRSRVRAAILLAPVVGLLIGLGAAVGEALLRWLLLGLGQPGVAENPLVALLGAAFALGAMQLVVGGMHLDGLADTVDGLAAGGGRSRILEVMRRSDIGPMGVIAVVFTLLFQVVALALAIGGGHGTIAIVTAPVVGRLAAVWGCRMSAARPDGLGAWVAGTVSTAQALVVSAAAMAVPLLLLLRDDDPRRMALPAVAAALPVALMVAGLLQRRWAARLGGITGDTLGAAVEIATTVTFVIIALAPG